MNKIENVISLIKVYLIVVKEGVTYLNRKYDRDPTFHQITENGDLQNHGYIEDEKLTYYEFHGVNGCLIKWNDGKFVDFNLGTAGRCDGFDPWFVLGFYERNEFVRLEYPNITIEDIDQIVINLMAEEKLVEDKLHNLYYFIEDYHNPNPFRWAGGEYPSGHDN